MGKKRASQFDLAIRFLLLEAIVGEYDFQIINFMGIETNNWNASLLCFVKDFDKKHWRLGDILFIDAAQYLLSLLRNRND